MAWSFYGLAQRKYFLPLPLGESGEGLVREIKALSQLIKVFHKLLPAKPSPPYLYTPRGRGSSYPTLEVICRRRQGDYERCALAYFRFYRDRSLMIIDGFLDDGKAETGAGLFSRKVRLEYF